MKPEEFIENPKWADFLPEWRESTKKRHLPSHEDCVALDADVASSHLMPGGTLGRMPNYESRPGQIDMLSAIVRAFNNREHLMVEAGTGVGKSLAYLIPSILWASRNDTPVVISTATRNLQSQLIESDIPRAVTILGDNAKDFKVALLKGRANYLCLRAVADFFAAGFWTMNPDEKEEMPHFIDWLKTTRDGDLDSYDGLPRSMITCPGEECSGRRCPWYSRCFIFRARKLAAEAHLIVANHSLVLAEATNSNCAILPAYSRLILDEAHNLEDIATDYLSFEFSVPALVKLLNRLSKKSRGRRALSQGILANIERAIQKGLIASSPVAISIYDLLSNASTLIARCVASADNLASIASRLLEPVNGNKLVRYKVVDAQRQFSVRGLFQFYDPNFWDEKELATALTQMENVLANLISRLHMIRDALMNAVPEGEMNPYEEMAIQVNGIADSFISFANAMNFVFAGEKETHAYWAEKVIGDKRPSYVRLVAAPLSVASSLQALLYNMKDSVVLSSATLRVGNDFRYMARRLGCELIASNQIASEDGPRFRALTASSPFDYLRQALVLAPDFLPDPSSQTFAYIDALANFVNKLFIATKGRALVLFTSYEMMSAVASRVRELIANRDYTLLVQGEGLSREAMTQALRESRESDSSRVILFGAQSFWEGVDIAGDALSCVVIARLPFAMVGDPIIEARGEKIEREGGSSFRDYSLPEAAIKFRQGFGRLIRSARDRGVVVVADARIVTKNYGATFRKSIPASVHTVTDEPMLFDRIRDFFE